MSKRKSAEKIRLHADAGNAKWRHAEAEVHDAHSATTLTRIRESKQDTQHIGEEKTSITTRTQQHPRGNFNSYTTTG